MTRSWRRSVAGLALALGAPAWARAQDTAAAPRVAPGDLVRLRARTRDARGRPIGCEGRVSALAADTLVLTNASRWAGCPRLVYPADSVASLAVARGVRGSRVMHAGVGLLAGGMAGGLLGWAAAGGGNDCVSSPCDDAGFATLPATLLGAMAGSVTGILMGVVLPAGPKWVRVPTGASVRVAGLRLQPSLRWAGGR